MAQINHSFPDGNGGGRKMVLQADHKASTKDFWSTNEHNCPSWTTYCEFKEVFESNTFSDAFDSLTNKFKKEVLECFIISLQIEAQK